MKIIEYEGIKFEIEEIDNIFHINIISDHLNIHVNNELIFSKQGPEEWKYIPKEMKDFVNLNQASMEFIEEQGEKILAVQIFKDEITESTVLFPRNKTIPIRIRFNLLKNIEEFVNIHLMNAKGREIEKRIVGDKLLFFWESIELKCTKQQFNFKYSGIDEQKYYGYWDITFLKEQWNNDHFMIILKAIQIFKQELKQIEEEFKII